MVEYILGNYMVSKGKISEEQLIDTLNKQEQVRVKLGLIAVSEGMITLEQADEINRLQAVCDKRFGDIAIEKGYMTESQLDKVLKLQGNAYLVFVQALVDEGVLAMGEMEEILEDFRKENGLGSTDIEALKSDEAERIVPLFVTLETEQYQDMIGVVVRALIRCVDRRVYLGKAELVSEVEAASFAVQQLEGEEGKLTAFVEADGGMLRTASIFGREEFSEMNEDVLDAAAEFLNCVNGIYTASPSGKLKKLELTPPVYYENGGIISGETVCRVPLWIQNKKMYFVIAE